MVTYSYRDLYDPANNGECCHFIEDRELGFRVSLVFSETHLLRWQSLCRSCKEWWVLPFHWRWRVGELGFPLCFALVFFSGLGILFSEAHQLCRKSLCRSCKEWWVLPFHWRWRVGELGFPLCFALVFFSGLGILFSEAHQLCRKSLCRSCKEWWVLPFHGRLGVRVRVAIVLLVSFQG